MGPCGFWKKKKKKNGENFLRSRELIMHCSLFISYGRWGVPHLYLDQTATHLAASSMIQYLLEVVSHNTTFLDSHQARLLNSLEALVLDIPLIVESWIIQVWCLWNTTGLQNIFWTQSTHVVTRWIILESRIECSGRARTIPWLLMTWLLASPRHQQPRDWLWKIKCPNRPWGIISTTRHRVLHPKTGVKLAHLLTHFEQHWINY